MPVTIHNASDTRVLLRFNSGVTRHLAPGEAIAGVEEVETKGNERIQRLAERRLIRLGATEEKEETKKGKESANSRSMTAAEAIEHIAKTPLAKLGDFVPEDEDRATVLRAWEDKQHRE